MAHRLEIALKPHLLDPEGEALKRKAARYFQIQVETARVIRILTLDLELTKNELEAVRTSIFTNPVTEDSAYAPLEVEFDWSVWVGYRPGVKDNPGATAMEVIEDYLDKRFSPGENVYTSKRFCFSGKNLTEADAKTIARELLANDTIQQWKIFSGSEWDREKGVGIILPRVQLDHAPRVDTISIQTDVTLLKLSRERNLALHPNDVPTIRAYFQDERVREERKQVGLSDPTDVELEYISQGRSDHCNHNTFQGRFRYHEEGKEPEVIDNLFDTCIKGPTLELAKKKDWVVSVLWDNAGAGRFDSSHYYVITGETHNSPSNMEAYGGAMTGIVGVYRDPMGTGKGAKLIMGSYGYCVGPLDYAGPLKPRLHPRRLLDGVIDGVKDGGNKSGIPTPFGQVFFHPGYLGKCLVFVTALGIMPGMVNGEPSEKKTTAKGEKIIMCGGRVGKDGIHGVTASSESFTESTPSGHVQIGDPYTQKKMSDFLLEARDEGLIRFITDNGGGGLSSSVGESARFSNGCIVELEKVPLKYAGLDQWEIWVSESQERMTVSVHPDDLDRFMELSGRHAVESTVIGEYTDTGKLHITYDGKTCAYVDMDLLQKGFPKWEFDAKWISPESRGMTEPVLDEPKDFNALMLAMMARPNIASKEWISRQYDHEVQGTSVIKPLVGADKDIPSDASVIRPVLSSSRGLAFSQSLLPTYSAIDAYHMTTCVIDEALRRLIAVGGDPQHVGGVDNFCWPSIGYDPQKNPDGKFKAAQLVRSCKALKDICLAYEIPLLSGKDSMYVDGFLPGKYGETHKVSALETLQFSALSLVEDIRCCQSMDVKKPGDIVYIIGITENTLGGSEYYDLFGCVGKNVPQVDSAAFFPMYNALHHAICRGVFASVHGVYRGGLGVHLALCAMGGNLGMKIDLSKVPVREDISDSRILFSESPGRFIVTVSPDKKQNFEELLKDHPFASIGEVTKTPVLSITSRDREEIIRLGIRDLKTAWKKPFQAYI